MLAVKPNMIPTVCEELQSIVHKNNPLVISLATGITIHAIQHSLQTNKASLIRAMPNVAATVSAGVTGLFANDNVTAAQKMLAESLFRAVGTTHWLMHENQLDAITAISGSGPAYLFYLFEAMQKAAESFGLQKEIAQLLIAETATGAAKMALESGEDFHQLRQKVTSPKGTTQAAIDVLTSHQVDNTLVEAIKAAYDRAKVLSS